MQATTKNFRLVSTVTRRLVSATVAAAALLSTLLVATPANAGLLEEDTPPWNTSLAADDFRRDGVSVSVAANSATDGTVCVSVQRFSHRSRTQRTRVSQYECGKPTIYQFHRTTESARVTATLRGKARHVSERLVDGKWRVDRRWRTAEQIKVDFTWRGTGPHHLDADVRGLPLTCYALPPICMRAYASVEREAHVHGFVRWSEVGNVKTPRDLSGVMRHG